MATSEMCGCGAALSESRTSRMAAGNYVRATELRVQMLYVALTSSDPEAVQLARDGKRHLDALHRVMHDPATPAVDYARILSWTKRATRVAEDRGVDAEHALWWVQQRRSAQQYLDEEEGLTADEPGWYVPEGQERWRWWDGERWADGTRQEPPPAAIGANALRSPSVETHNLAGRGERLIALLIDWAPLYAVSGPLYRITDPSSRRTRPPRLPGSWTPWRRCSVSPRGLCSGCSVQFAVAARGARPSWVRGRSATTPANRCPAA